MVGVAFALTEGSFGDPAANVVLWGSAAAAVVATIVVLGRGPTELGWAAVGVTAVVTSVISRSLFYVLVVPTTMPGAFFWKNKGFEEHARDIGLANLPQVGVAPLRHYP